MNTKRTPVSNQNKMFRSIVLMGSGLAFGCGGVAKVEGSGAGGSSAVSHGGTTGAGSSAGSGVVAGAAGSLVFGSGGTTSQAGSSSVGGSLSVGVAGSGPITGNGGTSSAFLPCPPPQWACTGQETDCQNQYDVALPTSNCKCDPSRPTQASDCKPGLSFVCLSANRAANGQGMMYPPIPFQCSCLPTPADCSTACDAAFADTALGCYFDDVNTILCGCSAPVLLK